MEHCPTLEELVVGQSFDMSSTQMQQILSSSPRLHTFVTLLDNGLPELKVMSFAAKLPHFMANDFIDLDPASDALKPWECESSLRIFYAKILGIPRSDVTTDYRGVPRLDVLQETYPGQTQELQSRVYERLARFTRLEKLGLGHDDRDFDSVDFDEQSDDTDYQYDCLEMTLKSGLEILEGLKQLEELNVMRMTTRIGVDEVKWMRRNWPNLRTISGLDIGYGMENKIVPKMEDEMEDEVEAARWLKEEWPQLISTHYVIYQ
ncbi:hypothetical protein BGZ99_002531 [Dissophora globulifera]|uniref:Uncharacterized protein n=1 Tax=Dissophora globulifera TaxID=979702 RepID=A0A9P6UJ41_9FUNG|nr:hypothetical protein BGZ99_002531 [Dissophora globulifera]